MSKVVQAAEFFVVGGPVQPDRPCYVERSADRMLEAAIHAREHCCVLGARAIGKTSLMARAARTLRQSGSLTAVVDLAQVAARGDDADAERWIYGIAHRVVHDLHVQIDLAAWWREQTALAPESRLADFFWKVVLTHTTAPVTVFIDEIERALSLPFGRELLAAIEVCDARRAREADYGRLSFVVLGVAARERLGAAPNTPLRSSVRSIDLADFTPDETYVLALGFGGERAQAQALMDRVCVWTHGHPYLTQKIARGVARKGGKLEDVERVVREQLLAPGAVSDELLLRSAQSMLTERKPAARQALKLLRRIAKGRVAAAPADAAVRDVLELSGVVARDAGGALRYRNRVVREAFGGRWVKSAAPAGWRTLTGAAGLVALAALGGYAYFAYLPIPYERVLESAAADPAAIDAAHRGLSRFPGFAERADRLLAEALRRRSDSATNVAALVNVDSRLRTLPGQNELADRLLADFWLRKVAAAVGSEQRDAALLFALRAAAGTGDAASARAWVGELVGEDYRRLERTLRLPATPARWGVDWQAPALWSLTPENDLVRTTLAAAVAVAASPPRLSALRAAALERELRVEGEGSAGELELSVALAHPASGEVALTLTAPSGAQATVVLPQSNGVASENYVFAAQEGITPLAALADEERRGVWHLTLVDRRVDNVGTLGGWGLRFGEESWRDDPAEAVTIPDPQRTEAVTVEVSADDAFAIVQPAERGAIGSVALWNLAAGQLEGDFTLPQPPAQVALNASATRLLAATANLVTLWNVADAMPVARLATQTQFVLPPTFSSDGGYVAIAERVEEARPLYSLLRAQDGSLLASVEGVEGAKAWWLGPGARYFALLGPSDVLRIVDARSGNELGRLQHARAVARVVPLPDGASLLTIDAGGEIRAWRVDGPAGGPAGDPGRWLGAAAAVEGVSVSSDGARLAYQAAGGEIVVRDVASGARLLTVREGGASASLRTRLAPDGTRLVTANGERVRLWSLPSESPAAERAADLDVAILGVDRERAAVAVGFRAGQLRFSAAPGAALASSGVDYFGHRGAVSALALDAARGVAITGGADGIVRVWDLATAEPVTPVLAHAIASGDGPILAVALSADARWIASAAAGTVRLWSAADGALASELPFAGGAAALAFAPDGALLAIGDSDGVRLVPVARGGGAPRARAARAAVTSVAFAPGGEYYASADSAGEVQLVRVATGEAIGAACTLASAVRWLGFGTDGLLVAATDAWLHSYASGPAGLEPLNGRWLPLSASPAPALAAAGQERVKVAGFDSLGALRSMALDLAGRLDPALVPPPEVLERDWPAVLGLRLDDAGEPVAADR